MDNDIGYMGMRHRWGQDVSFGLKNADRRHHLYIVGKTGSGKTTLLRNLVVQDMAAGRGVGVVDPHGELAFELLNCVPAHRIRDVLYFDPADHEYPVGLNVLSCKDPNERHLIASGVVSALKNIWRDSWGPRMEWVLAASLAALLECENVSLLGIPRMLVDDAYRAWVLRKVKDPLVASVWTRELGRYDRRLWQEAIAPIQNKIGQLLIAPPVRNILGQITSAFDASFVMNHRKIFIANLSKGRIGEDKANLLGAMLVTAFELAAMARANIPEEKRVDFSLYVDEFQNFTSDSFASILSESRKYRLSLTLANQHTSQLREPIRNAIFGNVGSIVSFRVGSDDAEILAKEFDKMYPPQEFTGLGRFRVLAKLLEDGEYLSPFFGETLDALDVNHGYRDSIIKQSRERYGTPRHLVEDRIKRWLRSKL